MNQHQPQHDPTGALTAEPGNPLPQRAGWEAEADDTTPVTVLSSQAGLATFLTGEVAL